MAMLPSPSRACLDTLSRGFATLALPTCGLASSLPSHCGLAALASWPLRTRTADLTPLPCTPANSCPRCRHSPSPHTVDHQSPLWCATATWPGHCCHPTLGNPRPIAVVVCHMSPSSPLLCAVHVGLVEPTSMCLPIFLNKICHQNFSC